MNEKETDPRLLWALRFVMMHPDFSPGILAEEWKVDIELAIECCASIVAEIFMDFGDKTNQKMEELTEKIWDKMMTLSENQPPTNPRTL